ncbi:hypothetical protein DITRI_Ditri08aG0074700 [Diplodiscus trichospermus]
MDRGDIERLKRYVLNQSTKTTESEQLRASTFVVTCALVWTCLIKVQETGSSENHVDDEFRYFCFVADCRNRPEFAIPETYFGNCLAIFFVRLKRSELLGENGVLAATRAIGNRVWEWENRALSGAEKWITNWKEISETGHLVTVSGSPKFRVYETDFGWGKPKKTELVHIDVSGAMYLGKGRDGEGGTEIGLALKRDEMEAFNGFLEQGRNLVPRVEKWVSVRRENSLILGTASCSDIVYARRVFVEMPMKNIVSCNSMLDGCAKCGIGFGA